MAKDAAELNASLSNLTVGEQERKVLQFISPKYENYEKIDSLKDDHWINCLLKPGHLRLSIVKEKHS
jgi:hypothetical protein